MHCADEETAHEIDEVAGPMSELLKCSTAHLAKILNNF